MKSCFVFFNFYERYDAYRECDLNVSRFDKG